MFERACRHATPLFSPLALRRHFARFFVAAMFIAQRMLAPPRCRPARHLSFPLPAMPLYELHARHAYHVLPFPPEVRASFFPPFARCRCFAEEQHMV